MTAQLKQHFRSDEANFIDQVQDWLTTASQQYRPVLTHFLNPREQYIVQTLVNRHPELAVAFNGGYQGAEVQRALVYPDYYAPREEDFELAALQIDYPVKFTTLSHRQILGTLLGSGLKRGSLGDFVQAGAVWQIVVEAPLVPFLQQTITKLGRTQITWQPIELKAIVLPQDDWVTQETTVSSLRLDVLVAAAFNYSRTKAKSLIEHHLVTINWHSTERPDDTVAVHDQISVRRGGRIRLLAVNGQNKKGRTRITLAIINARERSK